MPKETSTWLVVKVGDLQCGLPITDVVETMRPLPSRVLSNVPDFLKGVSRIRGKPTPVVDLGVLLQGKASAGGRVVTLRFGERQVGLAVDHVLGVVDVDAGDVGDLAPLLQAAAEHVLTELGQLDQELFMALDAGRVISEDLWSEVEGTGADA